jgi:hypothetical protein
MPGDKPLFFLGKGEEPTEKLGQKCELMDRKGQNPPALSARRISDGRVDRKPFSLLCSLVNLRACSRLFLPRLSQTDGGL